MFGWLRRSVKSAGEVPSPPERGATPSTATSSMPARPALWPPTAMRSPLVKAAATMDASEQPPRVGMPALEIAPKSRSKAVVTLVHAERSRLVARIEKTGVAYSYARQPDGTYRLAGRAKAHAPRLVLGAGSR